MEVGAVTAVPCDKLCRKCGVTKPDREFVKSSRPGVHRSECKACHNTEHRAWWAKIGRARNAADPRPFMVSSAKCRAKRDGVPFSITIEDIEIPTSCPIFGTPLRVADIRGGRHDSPSLDRIIPALGYIRGNIAVVSRRANAIKNDGTADEHELIAKFIRSRMQPRLAQ